MQHKLKQRVERKYTAILEDGRTYEAKFFSLRPARTWGKQLSVITGLGVVLVDTIGNPVLVVHKTERLQELHNSRHAYRNAKK